jgi:hypothetical protein
LATTKGPGIAPGPLLPDGEPVRQWRSRRDLSRVGEMPDCWNWPGVRADERVGFTRVSGTTDAMLADHVAAAVRALAMVGAGSRGHGDELLTLMRAAARASRRRQRTLNAAVRP